MIGPDLFRFQALWHHYRQCRRNKRSSHNALRFELDLEANLLALGEELRARSYRPGRSICFVTEGPKPREVFAADFRDRVVHHLLVSHQERIFEPRFLHDSYACRKGKGTLAASDRVLAFLRGLTANGRRPAFALHLDVASFFPSIHKETLAGILRRHVREPALRWLAEVLLFHDPTTNFHWKPGPHGFPPPGSPGYPVPAHKSLFGRGNQRGLPIGNLTSQFWGNVFLDELDQFVKRRLGVRHYVRYVDDLLLLGRDPDELVAWREAIAGFLAERLQLALRDPAARPVPVARGVAFVGYRHRPGRRTVGRAGVERFAARLAAWKGALLTPAEPGVARVALGAAAASGALEGLRATLASYSGHLRRGGHAPWEAAFAARPWLGVLFVRRGFALAPRWPARALLGAATPRALEAVLVRGAGDACLVFRRVGCFVEFQGAQRLLAERVLGLRTAHLPRGRYALTAGFPAKRTAAFRRRALHAGVSVLELRCPPGPAAGRPPRRSSQAARAARR